MNQVVRKRPIDLTLGTVQLKQRYGIANKVGKPNEEEANKLMEEWHRNAPEGYICDILD